jgi:hypothetical protein
VLDRAHKNEAGNRRLPALIPLADVPFTELNMKLKSVFPQHLPTAVLCLSLTLGCSDDSSDAPQAALGSVIDPGAGGGAGASASADGAAGATSSGNAAGSEVGGSNGIAMGGSNGIVGSVGQGGSAGAGMADAGGGAGAGPQADAGAADSGAAAVSYAQDIQPILLAICSRCHATDNDGNHNAATSYADAVRVSARIVRELNSGGMPASGKGNQGCNGGRPGATGCVSAADFDLIQRWIAAGTPE